MRACCMHWQPWGCNQSQPAKSNLVFNKIFMEPSRPKCNTVQPCTANINQLPATTSNHHEQCWTHFQVLHLSLRGPTLWTTFPWLSAYLGFMSVPFWVTKRWSDVNTPSSLPHFPCNPNVLSFGWNLPDRDSGTTCNHCIGCQLHLPWWVCSSCHSRTTPRPLNMLHISNQTLLQT